MRILVFIKIGPNSNVFRRKKIAIPLFLRIGPKLQCLEEKDHNSKVYKSRAKIEVLGRINENYNVYKDRTRIPMFGRIRARI